MKFFKRVVANRVLLVMSLPVLIYTVCFKYMPMFGAIIAFKDFNYSKGFWGSKWVGFKNFEFLFKTSDAFIITRNTVLYSLLFIVSGMTFAVSLAVAYDLLGNSKINRLNQSVVLFPHFISWVVASYFFSAFLSSDKGLLNVIVKLFGGQAKEWYSEPKYWPMILSVCHWWKTIGYSSIIYYSNIKGFNTEYYEAARIDGATWFQQISHITVPLLKPIMILMFIISVGGIFYSDFGLFYLIPKNSGPLYSVTSTIDTYVYNGLMSGGNIGMTTAAGFYQSVVGFLLVISTNAIVKKISAENAMF